MSIDKMLITAERDGYFWLQAKPALRNLFLIIDFPGMISHCDYCGGVANPIPGDEQADRQKLQKWGFNTVLVCADRSSLSHVLLPGTASGGKLAVRNCRNPCSNRIVSPVNDQRTQTSRQQHRTG